MLVVVGRAVGGAVVGRLHLHSAQAQAATWHRRSCCHYALKIYVHSRFLRIYHYEIVLKDFTLNLQ
jgi:hypothetical protein